MTRQSRKNKELRGEKRMWIKREYIRIKDKHLLKMIREIKRVQKN